jgi:hypothetical protein
MNWIEYVNVLKAFRARFGQMPPSILTQDGALDHMRAVCDSASAGEHAAGGERSFEGGQPSRAPYMRADAADRGEQGH